jgi:diguanylate cyclase (GGDEF)-like protein
MSVLSSRSLPRPARLLHTWLPVALSLLVAAGAGWAIMHLNAASYHASQDRESAAGLVGDLDGPAQLLIAGSQARLAASGDAALAPTAGAPTSMMVYYAETLRRLERLRASAGEAELVDAVTQALVTSASTQDAVNAGGRAALVAAAHGPVAAANLTSALTTLEERLAERSQSASRLATGGTMVIVLLAALFVILLFRRFDRVRQRLTDELHVQATRDPLTGLPNRRQLGRDLTRVLESATVEAPSRLVFYDLDGFKGYNDNFGHKGGDLLLQRLASALQAEVASGGTCYRLGGDEFCALLTDGADERLVLRGAVALSETGMGFAITSSHGSVLLPTEAHERELAMQLADERMYANKNSSRASAGQQTRNLALKMLSVQEPDVGQHSAHVAALAEGVGRRLALPDGELTDLVRAAELHDIGKIAIPFAVLHKTGPLDEREWELIRRHPVIGATILSAAPALRQVAEIVRNSHERFDGGGYPRGIAGTAIPLASRIVAVCDAYDAMVSDRPYGTAMSEELALDQLARCARTQFDPGVVAAFVAERRATRGLAAPQRLTAA